MTCESGSGYDFKGVEEEAEIASRDTVTAALSAIGRGSLLSMADGDGQEGSDDLALGDDDTEYDYAEAVMADEAAARATRVLASREEGGLGDCDNLSDMSYHEKSDDESNYNYSWEDSDGVEGDSANGKDLAEADAAAFRNSDGIMAHVEAPSTSLTRLWISIKPWRIFHGMGSSTVEALGLDPDKGVQVMLTTDQHYTQSSECPRVKYVRQVSPDEIDGDKNASCGEGFPLAWMATKRLEEHLSQNWPPLSRSSRGSGAGSDGGDVSMSEKPASAGRGAWMGAMSGGAGLSWNSVGGGGAGGGGGGASGGGGGGGRDLSVGLAARRSISAISECTGVTAELAEYALRMAKCEQQAQLNLLDEGARCCLEIALMEDRSSAILALAQGFPEVDHSIIQQAVVANPGSHQRQCSHVRRAQAGPPPSPSPSPPPPPPPPARGEAKEKPISHAKPRSNGSSRASWWRKRMKRSPAPAAEEVSRPPAGESKSSGAQAFQTRDDGGAGGGGAGGRGGAGGGGGGGAGVGEALGWEGGGGGFGGFPFIDLTGDEEVEDRQMWLEHMAESNLLVRLALLLIEKLRHANKYCIVCATPIDGYLPAVPIVCSKELCVMSSEDMGCGTDVESQVTMKGDTVDLLVDLFVMAVEGKRPEIAFPDTVQWEGRPAFKKRGNETANDVSKLRSVLSKLPSVTEMQVCIERKRHNQAGGISSPVRPPPSPTAVADANGVATEVGVGAGVSNAPDLGNGDTAVAALMAEEDQNELVQSLKEAMSERDPLTYPVLRWLLSANRAHVRPLAEKELIKEIPCQKQFMLVTGTAEREATFQRMKREAARTKGGTGSFFAFHGSGPDNWHGILHQGLKNMSGTKYMSCGQAYGKGIYMADSLHVSLGYAGRVGSHWSMSRITGAAVIVAVCEVVDSKKRAEWATGPSSQKYFCVPDEECVATRFLLINPNLSAGSASKNISASKLVINLPT